MTDGSVSPPYRASPSLNGANDGQYHCQHSRTPNHDHDSEVVGEMMRDMAVRTSSGGGITFERVRLRLVTSLGPGKPIDAEYDAFCVSSCGRCVQRIHLQVATDLVQRMLR